MPEEIEEIKEIVKKYMEELQGIKEFRIVFATRLNGFWKVVIKYPTEENPELMSMLMVNWKTKRVDTFREGISPY